MGTPQPVAYLPAGWRPHCTGVVHAQRQRSSGGGAVVVALGGAGRGVRRVWIVVAPIFVHVANFWIFGICELPNYSGLSKLQVRLPVIPRRWPLVRQMEYVPRPRIPAPHPKRRVILLGASNLRRSLPRVVRLAQSIWQEPLEIMAAIGHGRSFGQDSWVLGRKIPGILSCRLWDDVQRRPTLPTSALVTDIGNDILYEVAPNRLIGWVAECLDRLVRIDAHTVVTELPVASVSRLSQGRFLLMRTLFYPRSRLTLAAAQSSVAEINAEVVKLAKERKQTVFPVQNRWYGFDPVHVLRRYHRQMWSEILLRWRPDQPLSELGRSSLAESLYLVTLSPRERKFFGFSRWRVQPSGVLSDGSTVSLY